METNKNKWADRHAKGMTKLDVATEIAVKSFTGELQEKTDKLNKKKGRIAANPTAEAEAAQVEADTTDAETTDATDKTADAETTDADATPKKK